MDRNIIKGEAMQQVFMCPRCGTQNYAGQPFCVGCGAPLATSCPYCGAYMPSSSGFCTSCGAQVGWGMQQQPPPQVKQQKPTSGWAKLGTALFVLGVLCIVVGPVVIMLMLTEEEQTTGLLIKVIAAGGFGVIVGLPLMFKG